MVSLVQPVYREGDNRITIDIYDRALVRVGPGPILSCLAFDGDTLLSQAGTFTARFPANDPMLAYVQPKRHFLFVYYDNDLIFFAMPEAISEEVADDGQRTLILSGRDMLGELDETSIDFTQFNLGSDAIANAPQLAAIAYNALNVGKEWSGPNSFETVTPVYVTAAGESALAIFSRIADYINESFRLDYGNPIIGSYGARSLVWLGNSNASSGVRAVQGAGDAVAGEDNPHVCYIQRLTQRSNAQAMMTHIIPFGSGFGDTRLDLIGMTRAIPAGFTYSALDNSIRSDAAYAYVGKAIRKHLTFKDIRPLHNTDADILTAKNYLADTAIAYLSRNDSVDDTLEYDLEVIQLPNAVQVGMTIRVVYQDDRLDIDRDLVILGIRRSVGSDGAIAVTLTVSTINQWKLRESNTLVASVEEGEILAGHPQIDANVYWENFREIVGDDQLDHIAEMPFFLASEVVTIRQVLFRCKVERTLTAGKTYSLGGNTSQNVAANTGNSDTAATGGTNTPATGASSATLTGNSPPDTGGVNGSAVTADINKATSPNTGDSPPSTGGVTGSTATDASGTGATGASSPGNTDIAPAGTTGATAGGPTDLALGPGSHAHTITTTHTHTTPSHAHAHSATHTHAGPSHTHNFSHIHDNLHTHDMSHTHNFSHIHTMQHTHNMAHTHNIPHTHNMPHVHASPQHTHPLPALTESFGVIRQPALSSYVIADLEYSVNGGVWVSLDTAIPIDGGFYEVDVTSSIQNANGLRRPFQEYNLVQVRRKTTAAMGKSALLRVKIGIRSTIQSVVIYA